MDKLRFYVAFLAAKMSIVLLKLTKHNGTNFPGQLAIKICPNFLKYIDKPKKIVGVTGTNGKTTVSNMIIDSLKAASIDTLNNSYGSNIHYGIATSFIKGARLTGKCKYELAVLEIDERATPKIFPYVKPDVLLITNLFRDSMKRNAHPNYIKGILENNIPRTSTLILNSDDLISSTMHLDNKKVFFGIDKLKTDVHECKNIINDMPLCPNCHGKLTYEYLRYHHIGKAICNNCGFKSQEYDYKMHVNDDESFTLKYLDQSITMPIISDAIHNMYNQLCTIAVLNQLGFSFDKIKDMMSEVRVVSSRYSVSCINDIYIANQMAKENNALGSSRAFEYVVGQEGVKELILMMNCLGDEKTWSENTCWLYDCDFEFLNDDNIRKIIVTGPRGKDYHLRLLLAGVDESKIEWTLHEIDAPSKLSYKKGDHIYVFFGTDSLVLGEKVMQRTKELASMKGEGK